MQNKLHISKSFTLPLELLTSTQAILARKRSGKSYLASVEAEELLEAKQQVVVIDPTGAGYSNQASTGFAKALSRLSTLRYVAYPGKGLAVATPQCFIRR